MKRINTAKILSEQDLTQVLNFVAKMIHAERNRALLMITVLGGLCVKETATLLVGDVLDELGQVREVIHLRPTQTKNKQARSLIISEQLHAELQRYIATLDEITPTAPFFSTQKCPQRGFTQNTLTQHYFWMYKKAGIDASSESGRNTYLHAQNISKSALA